MFSDEIWWRHNKSNMADGRHIENRLLAISPRLIVPLTWNLVSRNTIMFRHRSSDQISNFRKFKMADGRHFENSFIAISQPRIIRFQWNLVCRSLHDFGFKDGHVTKYQNIANSKWRTAVDFSTICWKSSFVYISAIYCSINATFCVKKQKQV